MNETDAATILMTSAVIEIAKSLRSQEARAAGIAYQNLDSDIEPRFIEQATDIFMDRIKRVRQALETRHW